MTLFPYREFYNLQQGQIEHCDGAKVDSFTLQTDGQQTLGLICDLLVDHTGHFRYLVIRIQVEAQEKQVLLPIGLAKFNYEQRQATVNRLKPSLLQKLPSYHPNQTVDTRYEQRIRDVLLPIASCRVGRKFLQQPYTLNGRYQGASSGYTPSASRDYNHFPTFYGLSDYDNQRPLQQLENQVIGQR